MMTLSDMIYDERALLFNAICLFVCLCVRACAHVRACVQDTPLGTIQFNYSNTKLYESTNESSYG